MTTPAVAHVLQAEALLLDFDGPVAALMPPPVNAQAADTVREAIRDLAVPAEIATSTDHLAILRYVLAYRPDHLAAVEAACTFAETEAARTCAPSVHATALFAHIQRRGVPAAVVSNNSEAAVRTFLDRYGWTGRIDAFSCRDPHQPGLMKPDPHLIEQAAAALEVDLGRALFIGDTLSDIQAGSAAGVAVLALAKHPERAEQFAEAGAASVMGLDDARGLRDLLA